MNQLKYNLMVLCIISTISLLSCTHPKERAVEGKRNAIKKPDTLSSGAQAPVTDTITLDNCPRDAAQPVVKKSIFPDASFVLQDDHMTGIETLTLPEGDKVTIRQSGCEYYILKFSIETSRLVADTTDLNYWYNAALKLILEINKGIHTPLEIDKGLKKMDARIRAANAHTQAPLALNEEIDFGGPDPRKYLTIDRITKLLKNNYLLEITFSYGPI